VIEKGSGRMSVGGCEVWLWMWLIGVDCDWLGVRAEYSQKNGSCWKTIRD
jgi:hypothetical protein